MVSFGPNEMTALQGMMCPEDDDAHVYGSALSAAPSKKPDKELARPGVEMEVKTYNRAAGGGAPEE